MSNCHIFEKIKQHFHEIVPDEDKRTRISPLCFIVCLVFNLLGDAKTRTLESIRRHLKSITGEDIARSSFWERLSGNKTNDYLQKIAAMLMETLSDKIQTTSTLLENLKVKGIYLMDSSTITLWDGAKDTFPGTFFTAGIKWHACFSLFTGALREFKLTPASTHDSQVLPDLSCYAGCLLIFDLGYWDFNWFAALESAGACYLSRLKSNTLVRVHKVIQGINPRHEGLLLSDLWTKKKRGSVIEFIGKRDKSDALYRIIGFWNPIANTYHWYVTNLTANANLMYPLYRLRWQIELIFKTCKQSFNLDQIQSNNTNIIKSLVLVSIVSNLVSSALLHSSQKMLCDEKKWAVSFQRAGRIMVHLSHDIIHFMTSYSEEALSLFVKKITVFANDIFDPNYRHRPTTLQRAHQLVNDTA